MRIGVVTSYRGTDELRFWIDDTKSESDCIDHWEECADEMIRCTKRDGKNCQIQVFLFLRWNFWNEFKTLENHLRLIHQNTWLSNEVYLVIERRFGKGLEYEIEKSSLDEWFDEITNLSFDDILQTDVENLTDYNEETLKKLKRLVGISRERRKIFGELSADLLDWKYEVLWTFGGLKNFIGELQSGRDSEVSSNKIIILDGGWKNCRRQAQKVLDNIPGKKLIAVCTTDGDKELKEYAEDTDLKILRFSGFFDTRYFLQLHYLLQKNKIKDINSNDMSFPVPIIAIPAAATGEKIFGENAFGSPTGSLITSAFDPNNFGLYNKLFNAQASRSLFELFAHGRNKFVLPIATTNRLSEYLEEIPQNLSAWIHFGHGRPTGLQSFDRIFLPTEEWLQSFRGKGKSLRLAFFFSCKSGEVAKKFAEAGVKIAVGFEEEVSVENCMKLARIIIPLAFSEETDNEIITAFEKRCQILGEDYVKSCKPCIFVSK